MARQGKMHSSPFHVESPRYKYAIEHEVTPIKEQPIKCPYLNAPANVCLLWNSGLKRCFPYKCKYNKKDGKPSCCTSCAYCIEDTCFHAKKQKHENNPMAATYCAYYLSKETDFDQYKAIQSRLNGERKKQEIAHIEKSIQSTFKYIRYAQQQLQSQELDEEAIDFYKEKIANKRTQIEYLNEQLRLAEQK